MTHAAHALVIGKFYPPHAGHHLLVRTAAAVSERVTVVVMASEAESLRLSERVAWMREAHEATPNVCVTGIMDDLPVDFESEPIWQGHVALMRAALESVTREPVDAVFSSEPYGVELARRFAARHVLVDLGRSLVPISGTQVRARPAEAWPVLSRPVRRGLALRVVLVGAESTGKSTLAEALSSAIRARGGAHAFTSWVPEYGRELTVQKLAEARACAQLLGAPMPGMEELSWGTQDFVHIAAEQNRLEHAAAEHAPIVVADTDALATAIWHERYLGVRAPEVEALALSSTRRLYLLTHHEDVPFTQDGIRDGEQIRAWMTDTFRERLTATGQAFRFLRGAREERLARALSFVQAFEREAWTFAPPL